MSEQGEASPSSDKTKITRRQFLGLVGKTAAAVAISGGLPSFVTQGSEAKAAPPPPASTITAEATAPSKETEPRGSIVPLVVDFTPLPEEAKRAQEEGLLVEKGSTFDLPTFFQRLTNANYADLEARYQKETKTDGVLYSERGIEWLLKNNKVKEALCLALAYRWSWHGLGVAGIMRGFREVENRPQRETKYFVDGKEVNLQDYKPEEIKEILATGRLSQEDIIVKEGPNYPLLPYEILPLQDCVTGLELSSKTDSYGNPYYLIKVDSKALAAKLRERPEKIINCSFNLGEIPLRVAFSLPPDELEKTEKSGGWVEGKYSGIYDGKDEKGYARYFPPAIALETAYQNKENLEVLAEFARSLPDKIIVAAAGNSQAELPADWQAPENLILVAAWEGRISFDENFPGEKPEHDFVGRPGQVYYLDPEVVTTDKFSSLATAIVAEWLAEQGVKTPQEARQLLAEHSKIQVATGQQILDFGKIPNHPSCPYWDDPNKYQPVKK